jgi:CheY-like chemotaxis protein
MVVSPARTAAAQANAGVRALVVEDDQVTRSLLRHRLRRIGCEIVAECDSAKDAWDRIAVLHADLVTLDVEMPEFGGIGAIELFRKIRSESRHSEVVIISASAFPAYRELFLKEGAFAYMSKPIDFARLAGQLVRIFPELTAYEPDSAL